MMKRSNDRHMSEAVKEMLRNLGLEQKLLQVKLINSWEKVMGKTVANRTTDLLVSDKKLFVSLSSASLRQELFSVRNEICEKLNQEVGEDVISEVIFR
ncbi:MAG: DUF721 domain-containing protein [Bacteroidetes bacterium]|nr:MAG: DUF721 domain-containing protein [Bacteroidota bacterium]REK00016.1 MAG: DUF721 domain-containing protein [Bacteroidota bacterium]REK35805.1 MAG: DUF721 domain-containing protein [Bacteroidota bacterium]REK49324.1 MAG: DUF721 domain-containing protein [Bacteroidota bacterium]